MSVQDDVLKVAAQVGMLETALTKADAENVSQAAEIVVLKARIAVLEGAPDPDPPPDPPPPPPPPPPTGKTLLGISGSSEITGACQRSFSSGAISGVISRPSKAVCPRFHHSWKVVGSSGSIATVTDAALTKVLAQLLPGDEVEVEHETDVKDRKGGGATLLAARLKAKNDFYAQVKRVRPDLLVVNTFSSFTFAPNLFGTALKYDAKADVLGADLDGGAFPHDYGDPARLKNIVAHAKAHYGGVWTCPEFGWNNDPQGGRMSTIVAQVAAIAKYNPLEISWHNNPAFGATFTAGELAEYAALVKTYNG